MAELLFIGTGDAFGSGGRRNSAILVRDAGRTLLLDCGPTTLGGLKELGVDPLEIDAVAISHFHGDHIAGLPFLMLEYTFESRRTTPLHILGPATTRERLDEMTAAFHYEVPVERPHPVHYVEFCAGRTADAAGFSITPLPAVHHPETKPFMMRVDTADRRLVFSGDTGWHDELPDKVGDASLFVSECVFFEESYDFHLSHERLESERPRFRCDSILLTHLGREVLEARDRVQFDTADDGLKRTL